LKQTQAPPPLPPRPQPPVVKQQKKVSFNSQLEKIIPPPLPKKPNAPVLPHPNINMQFLISLGNRKPTNAEYKRVLNIEKRTTNPVTKQKAQNIINANVYSRL